LKNGRTESPDARPGFEGEKSEPRRAAALRAKEIFPPQSRPDLPFSNRAGGEVQRGDNDPASVRQRDEQEKKVAKDFESVLLTKVFEQVQASIEDSGFDEEDSGAQQVRGMFWLYLAQDIADKGGFGLWKDIYQHIKQMQGAGDPTGSIDEEL
jgi:Rod binding domain-containing protein